MNKLITFICIIISVSMLSSCNLKTDNSKAVEEKVVVNNTEKQIEQSESEKFEVGNNDGNLVGGGFYAFEGDDIYTIHHLSKVYKINKSTKKVEEIFSTPDSSYIIRLNVMDGAVYALQLNEKFIRIGDKGQIVRWTGGRGLETLDLGKDIVDFRLVNDEIFYIVNENQTYKLYVVTIKECGINDKQLITTLSVDAGSPHFLMVDEYEKRIYFPSNGYLSFVQAGSYEVQKTARIADMVEGVVDDSFIYFVKNDEMGIYKMDKINFQETQITNNEAWILNISSNFIIYGFGGSSYAKLNLQDNSIEDIQLADNDGALIQISGDTIYYDAFDGAIREQNIITGKDFILVNL